jgi:organic radical activating enzyme
MNGGDLVDTDDVLAMIDKHKDFYKGTVFTGGDPTFQLDALVELASKIGQGKVLYTGNTYDELPESVRSLFDIIVDGRYIEELKTGGFPASENQIVHRKPT